MVLVKIFEELFLFAFCFTEESIKSNQKKLQQYFTPRVMSQSLDKEDVKHQKLSTVGLSLDFSISSQGVKITDKALFLHCLPYFILLALFKTKKTKKVCQNRSIMSEIIQNLVPLKNRSTNLHFYTPMYFLCYPYSGPCLSNMKIHAEWS